MKAYDLRMPGGPYVCEDCGDTGSVGGMSWDGSEWSEPCLHPRAEVGVTLVAFRPADGSHEAWCSWLREHFLALGFPGGEDDVKMFSTSGDWWSPYMLVSEGEVEDLGRVHFFQYVDYLAVDLEGQASGWEFGERRRLLHVVRLLDRP